MKLNKFFLSLLFFITISFFNFTFITSSVLAQIPLPTTSECVLSVQQGGTSVSSVIEGSIYSVTVSHANPNLTYQAVINNYVVGAFTIGSDGSGTVSNLSAPDTSQQVHIEAVVTSSSGSAVSCTTDVNVTADPAHSIAGIGNPVSFPSLGSIISKALPISFSIVGLLAVIVFMIGALRYIASRGDPKAVEGARGTMTGAVIGLIIVLGTAAASGVFNSIFGLSLFGTSNRPTGPGSGAVNLSCAFKLSTGKCIGEQFASFGDLVTFVILLLLSIGGLVFFFMLIWGGIRYMSARGDEKAVTEARGTLTSAAVGFLLIIAAIVIIRLITTFVFGFGSF